MKKLYKVTVIVILFILPLFTLAAEKNKFVPTTLEDPEISWMKWEAVEANLNKNNKLIMVFFYTDWCGWCKKLGNETFADSKVIDRINAGFMSVKINPEIKANYTMDRVNVDNRIITDKITKGKLKTYPFVVFINPQTKNSYMHTGFQNAEEFYQLLDKVRDKLAVKK